MAADDDTARPEAPQADDLSKKIVAPFGVKRVRAGVAVEAVITAAANRENLDPFYTFYAQPCGHVVVPAGHGWQRSSGEIRMEKIDGADVMRHRVKAALRESFKRLGIVPRDPYNPVADDYEGTEMQNAFYEITVDEWARLAAAYGVPFEVESAPDARRPTKGEAPATQSDWRAAARTIADALFVHDTKHKTRDCLAGYAKRTLEEMQRREIHGPRGRITNPATVQREALQGGKWWAKKQK